MAKRKLPKEVCHEIKSRNVDYSFNTDFDFENNDYSFQIFILVTLT